MKNTLIWAGSVIGAAAVLALVFIYIDKPTQTRTLAVNGECLTSAPKDRTAITLRVRTLDKSAAVSMKQANDKINEITEYLKSQKLKMQTTQFDSYEKTEWDNNAHKSITLGIETNIAVEVSSEKVADIEAVITKFSGHENVYTENLRMFTSAETMKPILEKCLGTAIENARERANAMASGDNRVAGKLLSADYGHVVRDERPMNFMTRGAAMKAEAMSFDAGIVAKDTEVTVSVSAVFEIK